MVSEFILSGLAPNPTRRSPKVSPRRCAYQQLMAQEQVISMITMKPHACKTSFQSNRRFFLALRGARNKTSASASGFSFAIAVGAALSLKQQMTITRRSSELETDQKRRS